MILVTTQFCNYDSIFLTVECDDTLMMMMMMMMMIHRQCSCIIIQWTYVLQESVKHPSCNSSGRSPDHSPTRRITGAGSGGFGVGSGSGGASGGGGRGAARAIRSSRSKSPLGNLSSSATTPPQPSAKAIGSPHLTPTPTSFGSNAVFAVAKEVDASSVGSKLPVPPSPLGLRRHKSMWDVDDVLKVFRLGEGFQTMLNNILHLNNQPPQQQPNSSKPTKKLHRPPSVQHNLANSKIDDGQHHSRSRRSR